MTYDPYTATSAPGNTAPFAGGAVAADVAAGLLEEAVRFLRGRFDLDDAAEFVTYALHLMGR